MHILIYGLFYRFTTQDVNGLDWKRSKDMGLYLPDRCKLFDDEEVTDKETVGEKMLFMDGNPPPLQTIPSISI